MLDVTEKGRAAAAMKGPPLDFQQHLALLEAQGLVTRIDRPIDKDTELHPLVRWQFQGGLAGRPAPRVPVHQRDRRRRPQLRHAGGGRRARGLAAHLFDRHGQAGRGDRDRLDQRHRQSDSAGARHRAAVPGGGDHRRRPARRRQGPRGAAGADLDAGLRRRALSHRDAGGHARSRDRHPEHGHLSRRPQGDRPARRAHGGAHRRRRRLSALAQAQQAEDADAVRLRDRRRAGGDVHRADEARRSISTRWRSRAGSPARRSAWRNASASISTCRPTPRS